MAEKWPNCVVIKQQMCLLLSGVRTNTYVLFEHYGTLFSAFKEW